MLHEEGLKESACGLACVCSIIQAALLPAVILHLLEAVAVEQLIAGVLEVGQWYTGCQRGFPKPG